MEPSCLLAIMACLRVFGVSPNARVTEGLAVSLLPLIFGGGLKSLSRRRGELNSSVLYRVS